MTTTNDTVISAVKTTYRNFDFFVRADEPISYWNGYEDIC